jgi:PIN domain nuclease of toxin-antitoxin system
LVWFGNGDPRVSQTVRRLLFNDATPLFVSAVVAWEYADLERRGRFGGAGPLQPLLNQLEASVLDLPAEAHLMANQLPNLHRDPVDRMLIAHALTANLPIITADRMIRSYPVQTIG